MREILFLNKVLDNDIIEKTKIWFGTVAIQYIVKFLVAILLFFVGFKIIKFLKVKLNNYMNKSTRLDPTLKSFITSFTNIALEIFLFIIVIKIAGLPTTGFVTMLGAVSFAAGLAFQGSLSNFAGGLLILFLKPIKVGEFIEVLGFSGTVKAINIITTELTTLDNKVIIIPNSKVSNSTITNFSREETRRVDLEFSVSYDSDIDKVKKVILDEINKLENIILEPEPFVAISQYGDSAIIFIARVWTKSETYWNVHFALLENVKKAFDKEKIDIPYNVLDIRFPNDKKLSV